jgi:hypothetical protein
MRVSCWWLVLISSLAILWRSRPPPASVSVHIRPRSAPRPIMQEQPSMSHISLCIHQHGWGLHSKRCACLVATTSRDSHNPHACRLLVDRLSHSVTFRPVYVRVRGKPLGMYLEINSSTTVCLRQSFYLADTNTNEDCWLRLSSSVGRPTIPISMRVEGALTPHNSSLHHQRSFQQLSLNGSNHTPRCITCTRGQYTVTKFNATWVKESF